MCYSAEVQADLTILMERFKADISLADDIYFQEMVKKSQDRLFLKEALNLPRSPRSDFFKMPGNDKRIFPGYFTWVMVHENGRRVFKRMRYRVRPKDSKEEIPTKYNVFNARIDSLETRPTWQKLFTRQHGLFPFVRFFEWVEEDKKKRLVSFLPKDRDIMWVPCLWDSWENPQKTLGFYSFALITDDPPPEVLQKGHDRCPIFLREKYIDEWLDTTKRSREEWYLLLKNKEHVFYRSEWAA